MNDTIRKRPALLPSLIVVIGMLAMCSWTVANTARSMGARWTLGDPHWILPGVLLTAGMFLMLRLGRRWDKLDITWTLAVMIIQLVLLLGLTYGLAAFGMWL